MAALPTFFARPASTSGRWTGCARGCSIDALDHVRNRTRFAKEFTMARLTLSGVKKAYDGKQVVHGLDFEIDDGEFVVIVGPSGCGKSTLLRMIAGLEEISA